MTVMFDPDGCSFNELKACLQAAGAESTAASAHGLLSGMVTVGGSVRSVQWQDHVLGEGNTLSAAAQECIEVLDRLQTGILTRLHDDALAFHPLLPDDRAALPTRARALAEWCEGFLYGLALGGLREDAAVPETVREVMHDFYEISHAGFHQDVPDEADEVAYTEIAEYVRMSVLLLHEELQPAPAPARLQ
jgi:yecA family protein